MRRISEQEYDQRLVDDGRGIVRVGVYINTQTKTLHRCAKGHEWEAVPNNIRAGKGCPVCGVETNARRRCVGHSSYVAWLNKHRPEITAIGTYTKAIEKIEHQCANGHRWMAKPNNIKSGKGCPHCSGRIPPDYIDFLERERPGVECVGSYQGSLVQTLHRCSEGHEWMAMPANVRYKGSGCPHCSGHIPGDYADWLAEHRPDITALEPYTFGHTAIRHRCSEGHEWLAQPANIKTGHGCPKCSHGSFDPTKPAILYVAEHRLKHGRVRVNVGITNQAFERRYTKADLATVQRSHFIGGDGEVIQRLERHVHQELSDCLDPRGLGLQNKIGSRECFKVDFDRAVELASDAHAHMAFTI